MENGALTGVKVLDLSRLLPGPYCSMILADHGAEVIAIEDRKYKEDGLFFNDINRNKRHISLNLKTEHGVKIFKKLAARSDVIIEGFRPGVVKRLGVDYGSIKKENPQIIYCSISGFGQTGSHKNRVGHDVNFLSTAGILSLIGGLGQPPSIPGAQFADIAGGAMHAAVGILLALFSRERSGEGQYIDISMTDAMLGHLFLPSYFKQLTGRIQKPSNTFLSHRYACYNTYETQDGKFIALGAVEKRFWRNLCEQIQQPELIDLQYDERRRTELIAKMQSIFLTKTLLAWEEELGHLDVCFSAVKTLEDVYEEPLFKERDMVVSYSDHDGKEKMTFGVPIKLSKTPGSLKSPPMPFGEGNREVLLELGYSEEEIEEFKETGVM